MNTKQLIDDIVQRHAAALQHTNGDAPPIGAVRLSTYLALTEFAQSLAVQEYLAEEAQRVVTDDWPPVPASLVIEPPAAPESLATAAVPALAEQQKRRMGRRPGSKNKPKPATLDEIAAQLEVAVSPGGSIDPSLIASDDMPTVLNGRLRREETVVRHVNGQPVRSTRQFIELR